MIDIAAIKARADKAPKGPWKDIPWHITEGAPEVRVAEGWLLCAVSSDTHAEFIAHARTDIPALIAALEVSEAARVKAEQERDALRNFVADFADTNIEMLPMPHIKHPADEPDKAVSAAEVWEWQNDARRALEQKL